MPKKKRSRSGGVPSQWGKPTPRVPPASRKSEAFHIKCTPAEADRIRAGAAKAGLTIRDFLVSAALKAARLR